MGITTALSTDEAFSQLMTDEQSNETGTSKETLDSFSKSLSMVNTARAMNGASKISGADLRAFLLSHNDKGTERHIQIGNDQPLNNIGVNTPVTDSKLNAFFSAKGSTQNTPTGPKTTMAMR